MTGRDIYYTKYYGRGGGDGRWEKKKQNKDLGNKGEKGERKTEENYIKYGESGLKIHLFGLKTPKHSLGGGMMYTIYPCKIVMSKLMFNQLKLFFNHTVLAGVQRQLATRRVVVANLPVSGEKCAGSPASLLQGHIYYIHIHI